MTFDLKARAAKQSRETRLFTVRDVEMRDAAAGGALHLSGYACVTDEPYEMQDWAGTYTEVVRGGAFGKTLAEQADVRLLLNHDGIPMSRTKSGTLRLAEDSTGLSVDADLEPRSGMVNDVRLAMERGDLDEMSFAFQTTKQEWSPDYAQRDIQEVRLFDVSVVTYPANPATSAALSARMASVMRALTERRALDPEDVNMLTQALGWLSAIDNIADAGQDVLADYLGVPSPDDDDTMPEDPAMGDPAVMFAAARHLIGRLQRRRHPVTTGSGLSLYRAQAELLDLH